MPRWLQAVCAGLILLGAGYVYMNLPFVTKRMKVTLEFIVDGKPVTGSGVVEASISKRAEWISFSTGSLTWKGEAIAIDLPGRGTVFAVMGFHLPLGGGRERVGGHPASMLLSAFKIQGGPSGLSQADINAIWRLSGTAEIPPRDWPILIRFADSRNPMSAQGIEPDILEPMVGAKIHLKRVLLAIVTEPLTNGIIKRLPWLDQFPTSNPLFTGRLGVRAGDLGLGSMHFRRQ